MTTGHVYIGLTVDGFIARPDGSLDCLDRPGGGEWEEHGYDDFISRIDVLVWGRGTYETVLGFDMEWPFTLPVVVMSRTLTEVPERLSGKVRIVSGTPAEVMAELDQAGHRRAYVDGGSLVQSFLRDGLIEDLTLTRIPVLIGEGRPLFGALPGDVRLEHLETRTWPSGLVQSRYRVA